VSVLTARATHAVMHLATMPAIRF